jgi:hypothetical protein
MLCSTDSIYIKRKPRDYNHLMPAQLPTRDAAVQALSFSDDGTFIQTNRGSLYIAFLSDGTDVSRPNLPRSVFVKGQWVSLDMEHLLRIPSDHQPSYVAVHGSIVGFRYRSGRVSIMKFNEARRKVKPVLQATVPLPKSTIFNISPLSIVVMWHDAPGRVLFRDFSHVITCQAKGLNLLAKYFAGTNPSRTAAWRRLLLDETNVGLRTQHADKYLTPSSLLPSLKSS